MRFHHHISIRSTPVFALACLAAGCDPARTTASVEQPDSIVLERTQCLGDCPAYRLSLALSGAVHFLSLDPDDSGRTAMDVLKKGAFERLARQAEDLKFDLLPESMIGTPYCSARATHEASAIVTIFRGASAKRVDDYQGCYPGPFELRRLELAIDSTAASERWILAVRTPADR